MSMETSDLKPKIAPAWLAISLTCARQGSAITFGICFQNTAPVPHELAFSNRAHKAELLGLLVEDAAGQRLPPQRNLVIKPLRPDPDAHTLAAGGSLVHELHGTVAEGWLSFPGALYELHPGEHYRVSFRYAGVTSNAVTLLA
jgi:hypothetical protein